MFCRRGEVQLCKFPGAQGAAKHTPLAFESTEEWLRMCLSDGALAQDAGGPGFLSLALAEGEETESVEM